MKILLTGILIILSLGIFSQKIISGNIIDFESGFPVKNVLLKIENKTKNDSIGTFITDSTGRFSINLANWNFDDTMKLTLSTIEFQTVIICDIPLEKDTTELCDLYMYRKGGTWNGMIVTKRFLGIPIKKEYGGGTMKNFIELNSIDGKITLKYFCDVSVVAETSELEYISIKYKK
ncbi:MAG: carboxypeptidase regulatory-like domain-containing protein [Flavobacteriales bacterium]|nr:carboxypeptidase regulatory-like domain-containing protein [Flavobacteriales bacterium]